MTYDEVLHNLSQRIIIAHPKNSESKYKGIIGKIVRAIGPEQVLIEVEKSNRLATYGYIVVDRESLRLK